MKHVRKKGKQRYHGNYNQQRLFATAKGYSNVAAALNDMRKERFLIQFKEWKSQ